jgi:RNA polymerase primary sigma factor
MPVELQKCTQQSRPEFKMPVGRFLPVLKNGADRDYSPLDRELESIGALMTGNEPAGFTQETEAEIDMSFKDIPAENPLSQYLKQFEGIQPLTREEEIELAKKIEAGDQKARDRMFLSNVKWVVSIARKLEYSANSMTIMDLVQEGNIGLMRAIDKFDYRKGFKLCTYATWWIRSSILAGIRDKDKTIAIAADTRNAINRAKKAQRKIEQELGREPTIEEVAIELGIEPDETLKLFEFMWMEDTMSSMDQPVGEDEDTPIGYFQESPRDTAAEVSEALAERQLLALLPEILDGNPVTADIVFHRFCFFGEPKLEQKELGEKYGVTGSAIYDREKTIRKRLQKDPRVLALLGMPVETEQKTQRAKRNSQPSLVLSTV